jgi:RNA polymerase sigma factor (sigma-70 family)
MSSGQLGRSLRHLRELAGDPGQTDAQLLDAYVHARDQDALATLMQRHGPLVLGVCRRMLRQQPDVEDAFQGTFLVLVRKAGSIVKGDSLASWLYGVAQRVAFRLKVTLDKRTRRERPMTDMARDESSPSAEEVRELQRLLDAELHRLPDKYRAPLVLHYLVGKSKEETARCLGCTEGTVSGRLDRGRKLLRRRLTRRGLATGVALAALDTARGVALAAVPTALAECAFAAAVRFAMGGPFAGVVSERAARLAVAVARGLGTGRNLFLAGLACSLLLFAGGAALFARQALSPPPDMPSPRAAVVIAPDVHKRTDLLGDDLPAGALVRLGTDRARHAGQGVSLALARDGKLLATRGGDNLVRLWEVPTGRQLHALRGPSGFWCVALAPDGRTLATGGADGMVRVWDRANGRERHRFPCNVVGVRSLAYSSDGRTLAVAGEDNRLALWDPEAGVELPCLIKPGHQGNRTEVMLNPLKEVTFSPDDKALGLLRLHLNEPPEAYQSFEMWEVQTGRKLHRFEVEAFARAPSFTGDGRKLALIGRRGEALMADLETGGRVSRFGSERCRALDVTPDGRTVALSSKTGLRFVDVATDEVGLRLHEAGDVAAISFKRDGRTLAAALDDGSLEFWDRISGKKLLPPLPGHRSSVSGVAYSPDGKALATCGKDGNIRLWEVATGKEIRHWVADHAKNPLFRGQMALAFSPDGKSLICVEADRTLRHWELATGEELRSFGAPPQQTIHPSNHSFSADGRFLAYRVNARDVRLCTADGKEILLQQIASQPFSQPQGGGLAFSLDSRYLAGWQRDAIRLWETESGREVLEFAKLPGGASSVTFSPDGTALAAAGDGGVMCLWDVATGQARRRLGDTAREVNRHLNPFGGRNPDTKAAGLSAVAFSRDGNRLFGGDSKDGSLYVWDLEGDRPPRKLNAHRERISCLALSRDGTALASASDDGTVLVWDVARLTLPDH